MSDDDTGHGVDGDPETLQADAEDAAREIGSDAEPNLEAVLEAMGEAAGLDLTGGWDGLNNVGQITSKDRATQTALYEKDAHIFRDAFSTSDGRKALEIMMDMTIRRDIFPDIFAVPMEQLTGLSIARDAENKFVKRILRYIAQADKKPDPTRSFEDGR